jgi:uncharacterized protein YjeT (DUF2065 family)
MGLVRPSSLLLGSVLAAPALWHGLVTGQLDISSALLRFVLAVLVAGILLAALRFVTSGYGRGGAAMPARRATDPIDGPTDASST